MGERTAMANDVWFYVHHPFGGYTQPPFLTDSNDMYCNHLAGSIQKSAPFGLADSPNELNACVDYE